MPELPEVETIARTLAPQAEGRIIAGVEVLLPKTVQAGADLLARTVPGMTVKRVFRRAKVLLLELERTGRSKEAKGKPHSLFLAFHLKMTGQFFVHGPGAAPLKHTRLIFDLAPDGSRLFFDDARTFGYCRAMLPEELAAWNFWASLGPEPLETTATNLAQCLANGTGAIKARLLDQTVIAGCGNIYADESLFAAGIHPKTKANAIPRPKLEKLALNLQAILRLSIEECGSSIRDYRDSNGNAGAFQNSFKVYGRKGEPCPACSRPLKSEKVAGRTTTFCAKCQKFQGR